MQVDDDMGVFMNADFCSTWTRFADVDCAQASFLAIYGVQDAAALQGYVLSADHQLTFSTADITDLHDGQTLQQQGDPAEWRVRGEPQRDNDGSTSTLSIGRIA